MMRGNITRAEWERLRVLALQQNRSTAELVAAALRATYDLTPAPTEGTAA
jgi:hypothetical protein